VADRLHRSRTAIATVTATFVGLAGIGVAFGTDPTASAAERRRESVTARPARVPLDAAVAARARAEAEQAMKEQQLAQFYAAVAEYYRPKTGVDWDGIAQCETGGNWSMRGSRYSGGLGFYNGTWDGFGGREFASNAGLASREEQIIVAERVHARHGLSGWGCKAYG
jgi:hypothetical protein